MGALEAVRASARINEGNLGYLRTVSRWGSHWVTRDVVAPFVITRFLLAVAALLGLSVLPRARVNLTWGVEGAPPLIAAFTRWDWEWYARIAQQGYSFGTERQSTVAFFPLYPLLTRLVAQPFGANNQVVLAAAGLLVSNVALLVALMFLVALVRDGFDEEVASRAATYLLVFPTSFFLSAGYADSLFLAFSVASFYYAGRDRWWVAGALGGAAALTRPHGVFLLLPLLVEYLSSARPGERRIRRDVIALALVPAGLLAYVGYLALRFGAPLAFLQAQTGWHRSLAPPWTTIQRFFSAPLTVHNGQHSLVDLGFTILLAVLAIASWRLLRPSYAAFTTVLLLVALCSGSLVSLARFGVTFFPIFIVLALWGRRRSFELGYLAVASGLSGVFMALFAQWYWIA